MPQVSVIVPVYNAEQYLAECVDSILAQTLRDVEVILVDDGSTDVSPAMCDRYAAQDGRIICIHQENAGAAAARNRGLKAAAGKYIAFVDSDDWIDPDMYETMVNTAEARSCDLVICDCVKESDAGSQIYTHELPGGYYDRAAMVSGYFPQLLMPDSMEYPVTISNVLLLIRREIIEENRLSFPEGMRFSEDLLFGSEVGYYAQSMTYIKGYTPYHYRQNPASVTHTAFKDKWPLLLELYQRIRNSFEVKTDFDFMPQIQRCMLFFVYMAMNQRLAAKLPLKQFFKEAMTVLDHPDVREALMPIKISRLNISWKLKIISFIYQKKYLWPGLLLLRR